MSTVALLVLPWVGFLLDTWLGMLIGMVLYIGSRIFAPAEEVAMLRTFGDQWSRYSRSVRLQGLQPSVIDDPDPRLTREAPAPSINPDEIARD